MDIKSNIKAMPKLLLVPIIAYGAMCIFSIVCGTIMIVAAYQTQIIFNTLLYGAFTEIQTALELTAIPIDYLSFDFGVLTIVVGLFQGLISFGLIKRWKAIWILAILFTTFSWVMALGKFMIAITAFGMAKAILYIVELVSYFLDSSIRYFIDKK